MLDKLKKLNIPLFLLILLSLNSLRDINIAQSIVIIGLLALIAFRQWMEFLKKPDTVQELREELKAIKDNVSSLVIKSATKNSPQQPNETKRFF